MDSRRLRRRRWAPGALALTLALGGVAASSGRVEVDVDEGHGETQSVPGGHAASLTLGDVSAGAAGVIHVMDSRGAVVAGGASVTLSPVESDRELTVVVRAADPASSGEGTLTLTVGGQARTETVRFGGAFHVVPGGLPAKSVVTVTGAPSGAREAVLLVLGADPSRPLGFATAGAVGALPRHELDASCPAPCTLVVGRPPGGVDGPLYVVWDTSPAVDSDGDGLGDGLEAALGTSAGRRDTDEDGLSDGLEVLGEVRDGDALELPRWGADPLVQDIFVQMDWQGCDPIVEWCGPNNALDRHRMSPTAARRLEAYFLPDFQIHIDNGTPPRDPADAALHGAWGGARRQPVGHHPCNPEILGTRFGVVHRGVATPLGSGGGGTLFGYCFGGDGERMGVIAQEIGHNFGLDHGGSLASAPANCKPHYRSPMNYAYTYDDSVTQFSRGQLAGVVLNPSSLDETFGLGTTDPAVLGSLASGPFGFNVRDDGAVDWNRDGRFDTDVRGAPTWGYASCEQSKRHTSFLGASRDQTLVWLEPAGSEPRLYLLSRHVDTGRLLSRYATRLDLCDPIVEPMACTNLDPPPGADPRPVPGSMGGEGAIAAESFLDGAGTPRLLVVYPNAAGELVDQILIVDAAGESWTEARRVVDGETTGDPALVSQGGKLFLLAPRGEALLRWEYLPAAGVWAGPWEERFTDGEPVRVCSGAGVALARGYRRDLPEEVLLAAIPGGPRCAVTMARYEPAADGWVAEPDGVFPYGAPLTGRRPTLAYVPFDPWGDPTEGRFYLAWKPWPSGPALITFSEGNDAAAGASFRRFRFWPPTFFSNVWGIAAGPVSILYDPRYDTSLRGAWAFGAQSQMAFYPFADGIEDVPLRDQDDYPFIRATLACSLTGNCSP